MSLIQRGWRWLMTLMSGRRPPSAYDDPYAYKMAPVRRGPKGRSGAVAVAEPED